MKQRQRQRGGFFLGLIIGLLLGLGLAMGVALYTSKVPMPFVDKVPQRTAEQDADETEKNKTWDPNSSLSGKNPVVPRAASADPSAGTSRPTRPNANASSASSARNPADILADKPVTSAASTESAKPASSALMIYFVQAGAYGTQDDAEQQRAKLAMMGYKAKMSEREQNGHPVFRVRLGPFDKRDSAESVKDRLDSAGMDASLVQVQK
jgi:cell division protein FtsN